MPSWWLLGRKIIRRPSNVIGSLLLTFLITFAMLARYWDFMKQNTPKWMFSFFISVFVFAFIILSVKLSYELRKIMYEDYIETPEEVYLKKYGDEKIERDPFVQLLEQKLESIGARIIQKKYGLLPKITFKFPIDHHFDSYQRIIFTVEENKQINVSAELKYKLPFYFSIRKKLEKDESSRNSIKKNLFTQTYSISSDNHKFTNLILEETLLDEVLSEHESHINQIAVHGKTLTAIFSDLESVELFFILLSTILNTYTR